MGDDLELLTIDELAARLRVCRLTAYNMVRFGKISSVRVGRSWRIPVPAVREYLASKMTPKLAEGKPVPVIDKPTPAKKVKELKKVK